MFMLQVRMRLLTYYLPPPLAFVGKMKGGAVKVYLVCIARIIIVFHHYYCWFGLLFFRLLLTVGAHQCLFIVLYVGCRVYISFLFIFRAFWYID